MRALLLLLALLLGACAPIIACTEIAMSSVSVHVEDPDGLAIDDATLTFDSDDLTEEPCQSMGGGDYVCGYEIAGEITVDASHDGYVPASETLTIEMDADGCHVVGQQITIVLEPVVL